MLGRWAAVPLMVGGGLVILAGLFVPGAAWRTLYRAQGALVTHGPYAVVRHPQHDALFLVILGALLQWPTLPTLLMAPALVIAYVRLACSEEREMEVRFGRAYREYRSRVAGFIPTRGTSRGPRSASGPSEAH